MTNNEAWTEPVTADAQAICERLEAIHALLATLTERQGTQGLGWTGGPGPDQPEPQ
ncbi:hypothetical protein [Microbacterium tumbae]